jgi:hypothetical protein
MKRIILSLIIIVNSVGIIAQYFQKEILLDNYYGREAEFGDFDRDGDLDILMFYTYDDPYGEGYTRILENTENGFIELEVGFPRVEYFGGSRNGAINWVDYNNDGYLDVFLVIGQSSFSVETKMFKNNRDKSFTEILLNINDLVLGSCGPSWADFDNDGDLDLTIFGDTDFNDFTIRIYKNDIDNHLFNAIDFDFGDCILKSRKPWGDFNKDGYIDLLVNTPIDNYECNIAIFKNNGDNTFTKIILPDLMGLNQDVLNQTGDMSWGDYNNDGFLDILISGQNTNYSGSGTTSLYKNNGDETFSEVSIEGVFPTESDVSIEWGDFDSDGDLDILQTGEGDLSDIQSFERTMLYYNDNGTFQNSEIELLDAHQCGMSTCADYTGDYNLDLLVLGEVDFIHHQIALFENTSVNNNTRPLPPVTLNAEVINNELILSWNAGTDEETHQNALSYNVFLVHEDDTIVQPLSLENGKRILVGIGNAQHNKFFKYKISKTGLYKWGVQSIDQSYIGSVFSNEESIEVPTITSIEDLEMPNIKVNIFPNPFDQLITISSEHIKDVDEIWVKEINGRGIYRIKNIQLPYSIPLNNLKSGLYILSIKSNLNFFRIKIIKN